jgi:thioredoxin-related protein
MRWLARIAAAIFVMSCFAGPGQAARDRGPAAAAVTPFELVVFEVDSCTICDLFRRDVLPLYSGSSINRDAPIRFINLSYADESGMGLVAAISVAPTVVLLRNGQEVDRITGYTGPGTFLQLVGEMMTKTE